MLLDFVAEYPQHFNAVNAVFFKQYFNLQHDAVDWGC